MSFVCSCTYKPLKQCSLFHWHVTVPQFLSNSFLLICSGKNSNAFKVCIYLAYIFQLCDRTVLCPQFFTIDTQVWMVWLTFQWLMSISSNNACGVWMCWIQCPIWPFWRSFLLGHPNLYICFWSSAHLAPSTNIYHIMPARRIRSCPSLETLYHTCAGLVDIVVSLSKQLI